MASVVGTSNADTLDAADGVTNGGDLIEGLGGNDTIFGLGGADIILGGEGNDRLYGGDDDDYFSGGTGGDLLDGGDGTDTVGYLVSTAAVFVDLLGGVGSGGEAAGDTLVDIENVYGSAHADTLSGDNGANLLNGQDGDDTLKGGGGADILEGDLGDDVLKGGGGGDTLDGGDGIDTASYSDADDFVWVSLADQAGYFNDASGDVLTSIENLTGSNHGDVLEGDDGANVLDGLDGDDTLRGAGGDDTLFGRGGDDTLAGGSGADTLRGGAGIDTADYSASSGAVIVSLIDGTAASGDAEDDDLRGIENLTGSVFDDWLDGDNTANILFGGDGSDVLDGHGGADTLWGGEQPDTLMGGAGLDTLKGGGGDDILDGGTGADLMYGGTEADVYVVDHAGDSVIEYADEGYDHVTSSVSYTLSAGTEVEMLSTTLYVGTDLVALTGNEFENVIIGNAGHNVLAGGEGADTLDGGLASDTLTGGGGADTFTYRSTADSAIFTGDTITDFDRLAGDMIDLQTVDADEGVNGNQAFTSVAFGTGSFTAAGQIQWYNDAGMTYIQMNTDTNAADAEMVITIAGTHAVDAGWFVL